MYSLGKDTVPLIIYGDKYLFILFYHIVVHFYNIPSQLITLFSFLSVSKTEIGRLARLEFFLVHLLFESYVSFNNLYSFGLYFFKDRSKAFLKFEFLKAKISLYNYQLVDQLSRLCKGVNKVLI
jgi:hypothetical protein